jgi:hypothetical protein
MYGYFFCPTMSGTVNKRQTPLFQSKSKTFYALFSYHMLNTVQCTCLAVDNVTNVKQIKMFVHDLHNSNKSYAKDDGTIPMSQWYSIH